VPRNGYSRRLYVGTFASGAETVIIDRDTAGWGYFGENMESLIADEADKENMLECCAKCVPAYYKGVSEFADSSHMTFPACVG